MYSRNGNTNSTISCKNKSGPCETALFVGALVGDDKEMGGPPTTGALDGMAVVGALDTVVGGDAATGKPVLHPVVCDLFVPVVV